MIENYCELRYKKKSNHLISMDKGVLVMTTLMNNKMKGTILGVLTGFYSSSLLAQSAATPAAPSFLSMLAPFGIIMVIMYFLMIRPQKKKMDQERLFLQGLKRGDEVYTRSGLVGTIQDFAEPLVILQVSKGVDLKVIKSQIAGKASQLVKPAEK